MLKKLLQNRGAITRVNYLIINLINYLIAPIGAIINNNYFACTTRARAERTQMPSVGHSDIFRGSWRWLVSGMEIISIGVWEVSPWG